MHATILRYVFILGAASALLSACAAGGSKSAASFVPIGKNEKTSSLLYVVMRAGVVDILSYPKCEKLGTLESAAHTFAPVVANQTNGDILINVRGALEEYAHGGQTPIAEIHPTPSYGIAGHYAFDPTSSNIAVSFQSDFGSISGTVDVYQTTSGRPIVYTVPGMTVPEYLGYDDRGDLFVDGNNNGSDNEFFSELPNGARHFKHVSVGTTSLTNMGSIQWDGKYITLASDNTIYRLQVSGSSSTVVGETTLVGAWTSAPSFWIQGNTVIGGHLSRTHIHNGRLLGLWHYPQGGASFKTINLSAKRTDTVTSQAVSVASTQQ